MSTTTNFNAIYKAHQRSVQNFIFKKVGDIMVAEELTNDAFLKVQQTMSRFDETKSSMKTWIYNIATNTTIDYLRKKRLATKSMHDAYENTDGETVSMDFDNNEANPLDELIMTEATNKISTAIGRLPVQQAEILTKYADGFSYEEIAEMIGIPLGTVKGAMFLARTKMKTYFNRVQPVVA